MKDMKKGEVGYTTYWMIMENGQPRPIAPLYEYGGTANVRVECIGNNRYKVTQE